MRSFLLMFGGCFDTVEAFLSRAKALGYIQLLWETDAGVGFPEDEEDGEVALIRYGHLQPPEPKLLWKKGGLTVRIHRPRPKGRAACKSYLIVTNVSDWEAFRDKKGGVELYVLGIPS